MTLLRHLDRIVYFAHIPKTGGSSVEYALRAAGARRALHFHKRLGYVKCNLQHMHAAVFDKFVPPEFYDYGFTVTRHPFDRLLSEYKWRVHLGQTEMEFDPWVRKHLALAEQRPYLLDNHLRPQCEFVTDDIEIFRFEDGLAAPLASASENLRLQEVDTSVHRRSGGDIEATWSTATRSQAYSFYKNDFETFDYDPERTGVNLRND